jgi:hypothetical protein
MSEYGDGDREGDGYGECEIKIEEAGDLAGQKDC